MAAARKPLTAPIPPITLAQHGQIRFLHPGYPAPTNELLALPRVDQITTTTFGVHYQTALIACQIIADNTFATGRLTLDQAGQHLVDLPLDGILTEDTYYFFVSDSPDQYPVVASFQDWEFPHDCIPDSWPTPLPSEPIRRCGITNFSGPLERAHLVPQEEGAWFLRNGMGRYGPTEYWPTYQDYLVQYLDERSRPYLFARFAWAILFCVKQFVTSGITRRVVVRTKDKDGNIKYDKKVLNGAQLIASYGGGGSQGSKASGKRLRTDSMIEEDEDSLESSSKDWDMDDTWDTG